jgi:hypothetical protein
MQQWHISSLIDHPGLEFEKSPASLGPKKEVFESWLLKLLKQGQSSVRGNVKLSD